MAEETKSGTEQQEDVEQLVLEALKAKKPVRLKLIEPVPFGDETIEELQFRAMRGKDWYELPTDPAQQTIGHFLRIGGRLTAQPAQVIEKLGPGDVPRVVAVVALLMQRGQ